MSHKITVNTQPTDSWKCNDWELAQWNHSTVELMTHDPMFNMVNLFVKSIQPISPLLPSFVQDLYRDTIRNQAQRIARLFECIQHEFPDIYPAFDYPHAMRSLVDEVCIPYGIPLELGCGASSREELEKIIGIVRQANQARQNPIPPEHLSL